MLQSMAGAAAKPMPMIALLPMIYAMVIVGGIVGTHWAMRDKTLEIAVERTPAWLVGGLLGDAWRSRSSRNRGKAVPSSTSSSEPRRRPKGVVEREGALPAGLRLTASDRPGQAQPVPTRDIPKQPWGGDHDRRRRGLARRASRRWRSMRAAASAFTPATSTIAKSTWVKERAALGRRTGRDRRRFPHPVRHRSRPFRGADRRAPGPACDPRHQRADLAGGRRRQRAFQRPADRRAGRHDVLPAVRRLRRLRPAQRDEFTSPSGRIGIEIDHVLQRRLAFLDSNYRLSVVAHRLDRDYRPGVEGPEGRHLEGPGSRRAAPDLAMAAGRI